MTKPVLFTSMPFGKKAGILGESATEIDFDRVWTEIIRPATPESWTPIRIDEVAEPGSIPKQFLRYLREADAAVFDLTFANPNVYYELGVRHEVRPDRTILVAAEGTSLAFNVGHLRVLVYCYDDPESWLVFRTKLRSAIEALSGEESQVVESVPGAQAAEGERGLHQLPGWGAGPAVRMSNQLSRADNAEQLIGIWRDWLRAGTLAPDPLLELGRRFLELGRGRLAVDVLGKAFEISPDEYEIARTYAWYLRKNGSYDDAKRLFKVAVGLNENDVESLGMLGGLHKREGEFVEALKVYAQAHRVDSDSVYILLNLGALTAITDTESQNAQRHYQRVLDLVEPRLAREPTDSWDQLAAGEAHLALGNIAHCLQLYRAAIDNGASESALRSAVEQLELLRDYGFQSSLCAEVMLRVLHPILSKAEDLAETPAVVIGSEAADKSLSIVHISDLHFGSKTTGDGPAVDMHRFSDGLHNQSLWKHIAAEIRALLNEGRSPESVIIVISGDIAYEASADEYAKAREFFQRILDDSGVPKSNLVLVPGNHDINWKAADVDCSRRFDDYLTLLLDIYGDGDLEAQLRQIHPYLAWDYKVNTARPDPGDILGLYHYPGLNLFVAGLNSCIYEDQQHHFGVVGKKQLERVQKALTDVGEDAIRVAVLHHHVIPMDVTLAASRTAKPTDVDFDLSLVRDFGIVEEYLYRMKFDLVLHGHKHAPGLRETFLRTRDRAKDGERRVFVCGAGSAGVHSSELPQNLGNHFEILRFRSLGRHPGKPFVGVEWRVLDYTDTATWRPEGSWELLG